ncbi:unnamed protein product [Adineta ricciae]|uniref:Sulfhydryl oxidase n=1 Tax=Adineta ricciae TaxID=249248 RepID=A0A815D404_ADIRI|nr:unnamed protein product [Adineta ricciae]CAF1378302.1 unnamed protein product [Adineta ricciae]
MYLLNVLPLIFFVILNRSHPISSIAVGVGEAISLYNGTDKVAVLSSENFSSTVYQSKTAWAVEFYASWCGHCRTYANTYREVAATAWPWRMIVRIGAINCYGGANLDLCRQHGVRGFPTIRLIRPESVFDNSSKVIVIPATDAIYVTRELIRQLDNMHRRYKSWPDFTPANRVIFEELYARAPRTTKLLLLVFEKRKDTTGRQLMLDFSNYRDQMTIFRTTTDGRLWRKLHVNNTDIPSLFVILKNRTAQRIPVQQNKSLDADNRGLFNRAIRLYIHQTNSITNFNDQEFDAMDQIRKTLHKQRLTRQSAKNREYIEANIDRNTTRRKVNMIDLELALSHMFRQEIPQFKSIRGPAYDALIQWITILTKYFPGREPVMNYLERLLSKVKEQSDGFSGSKFQEIVDVKTSDAYLPTNHNRYQHCAGSQPQYRGYPCALWLLFHTLTVSQYQKELRQIDVREIPLAIKGYIKYFFTCRECRKNFMKETVNIAELDTTNKQEAILYLWKIHNHVNERLHTDITEDPKYPKVQFPSKFLCPTCKIINTNEFDISNTMDFLLHYYSESNIDSTLISKESHHSDNSSNRPEDLISKMEFIDETADRSVIIRYLPDIVQQYPLNAFLLFLILVIGISRYRHCKAKRRRYTL